jgi:hypothetical protein
MQRNVISESSDASPEPIPIVSPAVPMSSLLYYVTRPRSGFGAVLRDGGNIAMTLASTATYTCTRVFSPSCIDWQAHEHFRISFPT